MLSKPKLPKLKMPKLPKDLEGLTKLKMPWEKEVTRTFDFCPGTDSVERRTCKLKKGQDTPGVLGVATRTYSTLFPTHDDGWNRLITTGAGVGCSLIGGPVLGVECALGEEAFDAYFRDKSKEYLDRFLIAISLLNPVSAAKKAHDIAT